MEWQRSPSDNILLVATPRRCAPRLRTRVWIRTVTSRSCTPNCNTVVTVAQSKSGNYRLWRALALSKSGNNCILRALAVSSKSILQAFALSKSGNYRIGRALALSKRGNYRKLRALARANSGNYRKLRAWKAWLDHLKLQAGRGASPSRQRKFLFRYSPNSVAVRVLYTASN